MRFTNPLEQLGHCKLFTLLTSGFLPSKHQIEQCSSAHARFAVEGKLLADSVF
jgi:hypothetical protein